MNFSQWLAANSYDEASLSLPENEKQRKHLEAAFRAETQPAQTPPGDPAPAPVSQIEQDEAEYRKRMAADRRRVAVIGQICAKNDNPEMSVKIDGEDVMVSLEEHAIANGWDAQRTELEAYRLKMASIKVSPRGPRPNQATNGEVIEAALCQTLSLPNIEKQFKAETLEAAHKNFRNIGLQQIFLLAAAENGMHVSPGQRIHKGNLREVLRYAMGGEGMKAGFTTVSLPGILGSAANKELVAGYMEEDQTWREIAAIKSVSDFKAVTSYRMLDDMEYEEVGPGGKIKHGELGQESYSRQAKTYAKMSGITRQDFINDDLQAFDDLKTRIGRGSSQKFNNVFWTAFMSNAATFWTAARGNYITGATTTLLEDGVGLGLGLKAFRQMKSPNTTLSTPDSGKRIGGQPAILLVPPELEQAADRLFGNQNLQTPSAVLADNNFRGKYKPVVCPWLSDTNFTGNSTTAWFLLRNPAILAAIVVSFLNGQQTPTVESSDADFDTLGVQFRGYHDFGCDQAEYLSGVKSKGAA